MTRSGTSSIAGGNGGVHWRWLATTVLVAFLATGCGGRGGDGDSSGGDSSGGDSSGGGSGGQGANQSSLELTASRANVPSAGQITLTATVKDEHNVVQEGVEVAFQADSGAVQENEPITDSAGRATATLSAGSDPEERPINVTGAISGGGAEDEITLDVTGTTLEVTGPDTLQIGGDGDFVALLTDSDDVPIDGVELTASTDSGAAVSPSAAQTDGDGRVEFNVDASSSQASDRLTVTGIGETYVAGFDIVQETVTFQQPSNTDLQSGLAVDQDHPVQVELRGSGGPIAGENVDFTISRGSVVAGTSSGPTDASGLASVDVTSSIAGPATITAKAEPNGVSVESAISFNFVGTDPDAVTLTSDAAVIGRGDTTVIDARVEDPNGNPVAGADVNFVLNKDPSGGSISPNSDVTDQSGIAQTVFTAGPNISGQDGVEIEATVVGEGLTDTTTLTVSGTALSVAIGTGNTLEDISEAEYSQPWAVAVTDSTGAPAADRDVTITVERVNHIEGEWVAGTDSWVAQVAAECPNEDTNLNNSLDDGEDTDGDGVLEPDIPVVSDSKLTTADDGRTSFDIIYAESEAAWARIRIKASVENSSGTAFTDSSTLVLGAIADDVSDTSSAPPGGTGLSPYGTDGDCTTPG